MAKKNQLGQAIVFITGDLQGLNKSLKDAKKLVNQNMGEILNVIKGVGQKMAIAGAAITAGLGLAITKVEGLGSAIHDLSLKTGASAELLSGLKYAAEQTGTSIEAVATAFKKMQKGITEGQTDEDGAVKGGAANAMQQLGIGLEYIKSLKPDQQFLTLAAALRQMGAGTRQAALAQQLFGKSATDLLPMINDESMSLDQFIEKARTLGVVLTQEDAAAADAFGDAMGDLKASFAGLIQKAIIPIMPMLTEFAEKAVGIVIAVKDWVVEHKELAAKIVIGVGVVGGLLGVLGGVAIILPSLVAGLAIMKGAFLALWLPVVTVTAAITAGVLAWKENLGGFRDWLMPFMENMELVFRGGWDLIWRGIKLDFQISWEYLKKGFVEFFQWLNSKFGKYGSAINAVSPVMGALISAAPSMSYDNKNLNELTAQKEQLRLEKLKAIGGKTWIEQAVDGVKGLVDWFKQVGKENDNAKAKIAGNKTASGGGRNPFSGMNPFVLMEEMNRDARTNRAALRARSSRSWSFRDQWSDIAAMNFGNGPTGRGARVRNGDITPDGKSIQQMVKENERMALAKDIAREIAGVFKPVTPDGAMGLIQLASQTNW